MSWARDLKAGDVVFVDPLGNGAEDCAIMLVSGGNPSASLSEVWAESKRVWLSEGSALLVLRASSLGDWVQAVDSAGRVGWVSCARLILGWHALAGTEA